MLLPIVTYPEPILLRRAEPVTAFDAALAELVDHMFETMYEAGGVGLAAPQVNRSQRLFVVNVAQAEVVQAQEVDEEGRAAPTGEEGDGDKPASEIFRDKVRHGEVHFVNPEILEVSGEQVGEEGCLSIPGVGGKVTRAESVRVRFQDVHGSWHEETYTGYFARAVQHEYDHLEGRLFLDHLSAADRTLAERGLKKLRAKFEEKRKKQRRDEARRQRSKPRKKVKR